MKKLVLALGILAVATAATAMADDGGFGLGAGIVHVKDADSSQLWLTANLRWMLADNLALEPEIGWYRVTPVAGEDDHTDVFNGGGSLLFIIPSEKASIFAGAGLGAHMFRSSGGGVSSTDTKLGYHGLAGVDLKASRGISLFGAVRYEIIPIDPESIKQFKVYGGLRFRSH
jgi:hypothetical protein